jgi:2-octaprenyl-6-methoxyphenol hydroxylase
MPASTDLLIAGSGPVGCALALALRGAPVHVAMQEPAAPATVRPGFRPLALSHASRLILERVGVWAGLESTPIESVHASQLGGFGRTVLRAAECGVPALGYVTDYGTLHALLMEAVAQAGIERVSGPVSAACTAHAEGASEASREKRYGQDAVVGLLRMAEPAESTAFERFTAEGPLALLPMKGRYALIWSARPERARELLEMPEERFLAALAGSAGSRIGVPTAIEARSVQPLVLRVRAARIGERAVYLGNAAQTLHPVAGQGLNLGLRDAWDLAQILRERAALGNTDPGDPATLARYAASRRLDASATIGVTDALAGAFLGGSRIARLARGLALTALDVLPAPRRFFARRMIFGPSALP